MIALSILLIATAAGWISFVLGRVTAERQINKNHHQLATFAIRVQRNDDLVPTLSSKDRANLDQLLDTYDHINTEER